MAKTVQLPYLATPGTLDKALPKIQQAVVPERFNADFANTVLLIKGGGGRALIPFFKKVGFVNPDGTPTSIYERFRNPAHAGAAMAEAIRVGYKPLYQVNEYAHLLNDTELKGAIVQVTGLDPQNSVVQMIFSTFKKLKARADFEASAGGEKEDDEEEAEIPKKKKRRQIDEAQRASLNLAYTINLNLPATTNIEVFHAIFKSLKEHILTD